jgi:hypothetical protein
MSAHRTPSCLDGVQRISYGSGSIHLWLARTSGISIRIVHAIQGNDQHFSNSIHDAVHM